MIGLSVCNVQEVNLDEYDASSFRSALEGRVHAYIQMDKQYEILIAIIFLNIYVVSILPLGCLNIQMKS